MKQLVFLSILFLGIFFISCEKDDETDMYNYEATVNNKGLDCGDTFTITLKNVNTDSTFEDGVYYADNLDSTFKVSGLKIYLNCREPNMDEIYACTTMGISYPHIIVVDCIKNEE